MARLLDNSKTRRSPPARTSEGQENRMIAMANDLAEKKLRDGTASSQLITELIKRGSPKERIEREILERQRDLIVAKTEAIQSQKNIEKLYGEALDALRNYSGQGRGDDYET